MLKETVEIKVDYEKAGVSSEGCSVQYSFFPFRK